MGGHGQRRRVGCTVLTDSVHAVRVVPAVPTFAVDAGFWYSTPDHLEVGVGWVVRVPLGGRRVRGFVVEVAKRSPKGLRAVLARSGDLPVFDPDLLGSLEWAARHYVAPVSVLLERSCPPNNPRRVKASTMATPARLRPPLPELSERAVAGRRKRPAAVVGRVPGGAWMAAMAAPVIGAGSSVMVLVPTAEEAKALSASMSELLGTLVHAHSEMEDREITAAWGRVQNAPEVLVGTARVAAWRMPGLGLAIVVEDGRRAYKDRQTPTLHARDLLRRRSLREGFQLVTVGPTPSVEVIGWGSEVTRLPGRAWSLVEVVDRREDPPGFGLLAETTRRAIQAVVRQGGSVFLFAHRRGYAGAVRCVGCRSLRLCRSCGTRLSGATACERCATPFGPCSGCGSPRFEPVGAGVGRLVEEAARVVGVPNAAAHPRRAAVVAGSESDLAGLGLHDLVVMVDLDGLMFGSNYRAAEEALRIGARLASKLKRGGRMIVQTHEARHPVVEALRSGDPTSFLRQEVEGRSRLGYPPAGELMVIEARGPHDRASVDAELRKAGEVSMLLGPAPIRDGSRWLAQAQDLTAFKIALRSILQRFRDGGTTVRIDADPIDL